MPLRILDGYTLKGETTGKGNTDGEVMPVVRFEYRPPTAKEMAAFRYDLTMAKDGEEQHVLRRAFLMARLVSWDVEARNGERMHITADAIDAIPDPILLDMVNESAKWKPKSQDDAAGN